MFHAKLSNVSDMGVFLGFGFHVSIVFFLHLPSEGQHCFVLLALRVIWQRCFVKRPCPCGFPVFVRVQKVTTVSDHQL